MLSKKVRRQTMRSLQRPVTDGYLLALAQAKGGRLATMDQRLATEVVPDGKRAIELIRTH